MNNQYNQVKTAVIFLSILLVISIIGLIAIHSFPSLFFSKNNAPVSIPDNYIGDDNTITEQTPHIESAMVCSIVSGMKSDISPLTHPALFESADTDSPDPVLIKLHAEHAGDNERFHVSNMLPGDSVTKIFRIKVYHDADITLFFSAELTEQTKSLANILNIKITHLNSGKVICNAPLAEANQLEFSTLLIANADKESEADYRIDISLPTYAGNEYQAAMLKADFNWFVKDTGGLVDPPHTGYRSYITIGAAVIICTVVLAVIILIIRKKK